MTTVLQFPKRQRQVFPPDQVAHLWAHPLSRNQTSARNAGHTFYFEGDTIYSYGHHFPIARHIENKHGTRAILFTTDSYSITTSAHITKVRRAIPNDAILFHVSLRDKQDATPAEHFADYVKNFEETLEKAGKARNYRLSLLHSAHAFMVEANSFAEFYGLKRRITLPADYDARLQDAEQRQQELEKKNEAKRERQRLEWEAKNAQRIQEANERLAGWLNGAQGSFDGYVLGFAYLRTQPGNPEVIETSMGAQFPADHGERAFRLLNACRKAGRTYHRNGHTIHCGAFAVDDLNAEGIVSAGCHRIEWSEIERFANLMGWNAGNNAAATEGGAV